MKQMFFAAALLLLPGAAMAADATAFSVAQGGSNTCIDGIRDNEMVCHHVAAGHEIVLRADETEEGACTALKAEVYQSSERLDMPMPDAAITQAEKNNCHHQQFTFTAPDVRVPSQFFFRVLERDSRGNWGQGHDTAFMVYPKTQLDAVKSWAKNEKNALVVQDKEGEFTAFLDGQKIEYYTAATAPRDTTITAVVVGQPDDIEKPLHNTLYLDEKSKGLASVRVLEKDGIVTVRAQLKIAGALKSGDPLAEKEFAELFGLVAK
jgi:hypothetical protein